MRRNKQAEVELGNYLLCRIQGPQPVPGVVKYRGTARVIAMVYREEGSGLSLIFLENVIINVFLGS